METFFEWLAFIGAWLLFAGPIYQAALKLQDEDIEFDRIRAAGSKIERPPKVSSWWWILPPIKFYKELKRGNINRQSIIKALPSEDVEAIISFNSKATAWLMVAVGGLCVACQESYTLTQHNKWNNIVLLLLIVGMFGLSILNLVSRLNRAKEIKNL